VRGKASPNPGRIAAVHRLNRAEYNNAIRDLLALDIGCEAAASGDETADGSFDNFADSLSIRRPIWSVHVGGSAGYGLATGLPSRKSDDETFEFPCK